MLSVTAAFDLLGVALSVHGEWPLEAELGSRGALCFCLWGHLPQASLGGS